MIMTEGARIFIQGFAFGFAVYMVFDFIAWFKEE